MGSILDKIVATKKQEVAAAKELISINDLVKKLEILKARNTASLAASLTSEPGIIAEYKRASPSKGVINSTHSVDEIVTGYHEKGAAAISVLTDPSYFQAREDDFKIAKGSTDKPILRKEFIINEYQLYQSKVLGADIILLIAAILSKEQIKLFTKVAHNLGMEVLLELHDPLEIELMSGEEDLIGINNRNLKTFTVDIKQSVFIKQQLTNYSVPFISESGLSSIKELKLLLNEGFSGFLMGEYFMKQSNPINAFASLNKQLKEIL